LQRPLDPVARARVEGAIPLAYRLAWRWARQRAPGVPPDELIAEALYGLTYAAGMFDETRGVPFPAYAALVIRHRLIHLVRVWRRAGRVGPYPGQAAAGDDAPWEAADDNPGPDPVTGLAAREMCDRVRRALPRQWYTVLRLRHAEGRTFQEIGRRYGVSRQCIQQIVTQATERARESFPEWAAGTPPRA
jgi:RNA polymerase sigma factor (sigma-70 family)